MTPAYCQENDAGGLHGVLWGKHDPAMVDPPVKLGVRGATDREVPFKEVVLQETVHMRDVWVSVCVCVCVGGG